MAQHNPNHASAVRFMSLLMIGFLLSGCSLTPPATEQEQKKVDAAGKAYELPYEKRPVPDLPDHPDWQDVLQRAFLTNGDLEAAYFDWRGAMARVRGDSTWPNSNVQVGYAYTFSKQNMKAWDRTTLSVGFDPSVPLEVPQKAMQAGQVALDDAKAKGARFEAAKFALQQKVLTAYLDYALAAEKARIEQETLSLLSMLASTSRRRVETGGPQQDLLKAQTELELAQNELANLQSDQRTMRAMLNGILNRPATAALDPPDPLPAARSLPGDDAALLQLGIHHNPDLAALAMQVAGRSDAVELARLAYIPDFSPQFSLEGNMSQVIGTAIMLPSTLPKIRAAIDEARADLHATQAMVRQQHAEHGAHFVATLYALRNNERQVDLLEHSVLPKARQVLDSSNKAYATGAVSFVDLIDSQRTLLDVRLLLAEARIDREKRLAELEALAGVDIETLGSSTTTRPATQPAP